MQILFIFLNLNKNLSENKVADFSESERENLIKNAANKNSYENLEKSEQSSENLDKNSSEANSRAEILSQATSKCKAQNFFKKRLNFRFKLRQIRLSALVRLECG